MAANLGRKVTFTWGGAAVLGVREKGVTINGEPIDITSDDDNGWRSLLAEPGESSVDISISGVTKDDIFLVDLFAGNRQKPTTLIWPNGAILSGTFHLASTSQTNPYKEATTFEASLQSTGPVTYTPAP
jgi:predicted secreted protein